LGAEFACFGVVHRSSLAGIKERALTGGGVDYEDVVRDFYGYVSWNTWVRWGHTDFGLFETLDVRADTMSYEDEAVGGSFRVWAY
jgi:hypothetical protein